MQSDSFNITEHGFEEVSIDQGMTDGAAYTGGCSGAVSDCCTRTCTRTASYNGNFSASEEAWEQFLKVEGGQVQY